MLSSMLQLVSSTHATDRPYDRICVLHPIRTMAGLKTRDEELNCIALGHELLNETDVSLTTLMRIAGVLNDMDRRRSLIGVT